MLQLTSYTATTYLVLVTNLYNLPKKYQFNTKKASTREKAQANLVTLLANP